MKQTLLHLLVLVLCLADNCNELRAQSTLILHGTPSTSTDSDRGGQPFSLLPIETVLSQAVVGKSHADSIVVLSGIDYIRAWGRRSTEVTVSLPDADIPVGQYIRVPVVVSSTTTMPGALSVKGRIQFVYQCELVDLFGVNESNIGNGQCTAEVSFSTRIGQTDTIWIEGISKLCAIVSTTLVGVQTRSESNRGLSRVQVIGGELRQGGHCVTEGSRRLVKQSVLLQVFPNPSRGAATIGMESLVGHGGRVLVHDLNGNLVDTIETGEFTGGTSYLPINLTKHPEGTYFIEYHNEGGVSATSLTVSRQ